MDKTVDNNKSIKNRERITKILDIGLVIVGALALVFAGVLFFQKTYYEPFYVNGQSMYPTLNKEATRVDGTKEGIYGGTSDIGDHHLDYGIMDCHKKAIDNLKRFDIVVTYKDKTKSLQLIKRLVGLPGETIKFVSTKSSDPANGDLYVKQGDNFVLVPQPIENEYKIAATDYPKNEIVLGEDEYYFLGDNRAHSSDCRTWNAFKKDWIVGKVVALTGYCSLKEGDYGENVPYKIRYFAWPRFIK